MWYVLRRQADVCVLSSWASGPGHACQSTRTCVSANPLTSVIVKRSASLFCKGPGGTYLRLCGPDGLCCNYSALLQMINKWVDMTMFQSKHTYKIVGGGWAPCHHLPPPPQFGDLSRPLAHLVPGECLWSFHCWNQGPPRTSSRPPRHTHVWRDITGVRAVPGLQTWGLHGRSLVTVGWDPPLAEAGTAGTGGPCLSRVARAGA